MEGRVGLLKEWLSLISVPFAEKMKPSLKNKSSGFDVIIFKNAILVRVVHGNHTRENMELKSR